MLAIFKQNRKTAKETKLSASMRDQTDSQEGRRLAAFSKSINRAEQPIL